MENVSAENVITKKRNANIELLRIISMLMVFVLHGLDKGGALNSMFPDGSPVAVSAWVLESLSITAVNIYMMISGYFLVKSSFKTGRILELIFQVLFYSIGMVFLLDALHICDISAMSRYEWIIVLFPFHMGEYWFATSYILMYMFFPIIAPALCRMKKSQLLTIIFILLLYQSVFKSVMPISFENDDKGYSVIWFLTVFLIGAYLRLFGTTFLDKAWKGFLLYIISALLIFAENGYLQYRYSMTQSFELIQGVSYHYNHILVVTEALGMFIMFINAREIKGWISKLILFISPMAFGAYLMHDQRMLRFTWPELVGITNAISDAWYIFVLKTLAAVVVFFLICIVFDYIRRLIFTAVGRICRKTVIGTWMQRLDDVINGRIEK